MSITARFALVLTTALFVACAEESPAPAPEPADEPPEEEVLAEPEPEPVPEPVEVPTCPTDTWSVGANGPNRATESGVEAAGWARSMGASWSSLRVCRIYGEDEIRLSCAPVERGAECSLSLPGEVCNATIPGPTLPAVVGQLVDTHEQPSEGTWTCRRR